MRSKQRIIRGALVATAVVAVAAIAGCDSGGGGGDITIDDPASFDTDDAADSNDLDTGGSDDGGDADVVITIDGDEYPVTTVQECDITPSSSADQDMAVYGFAESGERIELTFSGQSADTAPSGEDRYYGSVGLLSGEESWDAESDEPWPFLTSDSSSASGSVMMEERDSGASVEVSFDVTCD